MNKGMKMSEILTNQMIQIVNGAKNAINHILNSNHVESLNYYTYVVNGYATNYTFYNCDKDGYGIAYSLSDIEKVNNEFIFNLSDSDETCVDSLKLKDFNTTELIYILTMLEDLFDNINSYNLPKVKSYEFLEDFVLG